MNRIDMNRMDMKRMDKAKNIYNNRFDHNNKKYQRGLTRFRLRL